jgi:hypothetical protein
MNKNGPEIIIEDDPDDQEVLTDISISLNNVAPFVVLPDVTIPRLNGFAIKKRMVTNQALQIKCIPSLFFKTCASKQAVIGAYRFSVPGHFIKEGSMAAPEKRWVSSWNSGRGSSYRKMNAVSVIPDMSYFYLI